LIPITKDSWWNLEFTSVDEGADNSLIEEARRDKNHNLMLNYTSLRHLAAIKCTIASISDKQGKSGRITDRQILNLEKNTHHYTKARRAGDRRAELLEQKTQAADRGIDSFFVVINDIKTSPFLTFFIKFWENRSITTKKIVHFWNPQISTIVYLSRFHRVLYSIFGLGIKNTQYWANPWSKGSTNI
jgi:hypothetical protein